MNKRTIIVTVIGILFLAFVFGLVVNYEAAAGEIFKIATKWVMGVRPEVEKFEWNLDENAIHIKNFYIRNPWGFQPEEHGMLQVPNIDLVYVPQSFLKGKIHLEKLEVHIKQLTIVRNKRGKVNVESLKVVQEARREVKRKARKRAREKDKKETPKATPKEEEKSKSSNIQIDNLHLRHQWIVFKDYTQEKWPFVKEYHGVLNEKFRNVTDLEKLKRDIIGRIIVSSAFSSVVKSQTGLWGKDVYDFFSPPDRDSNQVVEELMQVLLGLKRE